MIAMTKEEIIEKLKKLRRLADDGVDGEKDNARRRVEELMAKYGITEDDLADEKENIYTYYIDGIFCWDLMKQIACVMNNDFKIMYLPLVKLPRDVRATIKHYADGKKHNVVMTCTATMFIELTSKYEVLFNGLKKQADAFFYAFLDANDLLLRRSKNTPEPTEEEMEMYKRASRMSLGIDKVNVFKQLEANNGKANS